MFENPRAPWWALGISVGIIFYLTLYPFHPVAQPSPFDWSLPFLSPKHHSLFDFSSNVLLFLPFGFFMALALGRCPKGLAGTLLGALLLSGLIESLQRYFPARHPGISDIMANVLGAFLGFLGAAFFRGFLSWHRSLLPLLLAVFFLYRPFFLSFDPGEVWAHLKTLHWSLGLANLALPAFLLALWGSWGRVSPGRFLLMGSLLESGRLFMLTAHLSPPKSLARLGLSLAFYYALRWCPQRGNLAFVLAYLFEALVPFRFNWSHKFFDLVPFEGYLRHFYVGTLFNLLGTLFLFVLWPLINREHPIRSAMALALLAEGIQIFVAGRYPDLTTVLLAGLGAWTGLKFLVKGKER